MNDQPNDTLHPVPEPPRQASAMLQRSSDAAKFADLAAICGDLHFAEGFFGPHELHAAVADPQNFAFLGERVGFLFLHLYTSAYELVILPDPSLSDDELGAQLREAIMLMMTHTDCRELLSRVPPMNVVSRRALVATGFEQTFQTVTNYVLTLEKWAFLEPRIAEVGERFHVELSRQGVGAPAGDRGPADSGVKFDAAVFAGILVACALSGMPAKGVYFYNRWAIYQRQPLASSAPPTDYGKANVLLGGARIELSERGIEVLSRDAA